MKKIYLLSLLSIFSLNLYCQVHWEKHPDNPVILPGSAEEWDEEFNEPSSVIFFDDTYHMWYTGSWNNLRVGHATSPDGLTWIKDTNNPVLDAGPEGEWDDAWVVGGPVLVINSVFHMWYIGNDVADSKYVIGHATSLDGTTWMKDTNNPVLEFGPDGEWDDAFVGVGSVIYDGSKFHMWYDGWNGNQNKIRIGHATSPDGESWTKDPLNPVLSYESGKWDYPMVLSPRVIYDGNTYHMWYHGGNLFPSWSFQIGYATSDDGIVWTKYANNPVLMKGSAGSWDSKFVRLGSVIDSSGVKYKMWYGGGTNSEKGSIGYAESRVYVNIPETAFLAALIEEGVDTNEDGQISYIEAGVVTTLDVNGRGISDMTGIEAFVNLESLDCGENQLTSLDVSQNTALTDLYLDDNDLDSLDISNNDSIKSLGLRNMPSLNEVCVGEDFNANSLSILTNGSPNICFETDCNGSCGTSIEKFSNTILTMYPNPTNNILTIETDHADHHSIEINSLSGQLIYKGEMDGNFKQIDMTQFMKGVYFVTVKSKEFVRTEKIIKM